MSDEQNKEWRKLNFAQRDGKAPLPDALEVGKLSQQFRLDAWECVDASIARGWGGIDENGFGRGWFENTTDGKFWKAFARAYFKEVHEIPHDRHPEAYENFFGGGLRSTILAGEVWDVLTLFEYMLRTHGMTRTLEIGIEHAFEKSSYILDTSEKPICIMPSVNEEGKKAMQLSLDDLQKAGMSGALNHLRNSGKHIIDGKYVDSLWESILALEWVADEIAGKDAPLGKALNILEKKKLLDAQLKSGIEQFCAYANKKARHASPNKAKRGKGTPPPEMDEALLIYSTCASCAAYLAGKQRKIKPQN